MLTGTPEVATVWGVTRSSEKPPAESISAVLGRGLASMRASQQLRQEDVAEAMQGLGLAWERVTVAAVEVGRRTITLLEGAALNVVLGELTEGKTRIWDLVDETATVRFGPRSVLSGTHVRYLLGMTNPGDEWIVVDAIPTAAERKAAARLGVDVDRLRRLSEALWGHHFDAERDGRLMPVDGESARSTQARRGHIARELVTELSDAMGEGK